MKQTRVLDSDRLALAGGVFSDDAAEPHVAKPYGPIGLVLSTIAILAAMLLVTLLVTLVAFGIGAAIMGAHEALGLLTGEKAQQPIALAGSLVVYAALAGAILAAARIRGGKRWRDLVGWHGWTPFRGSWFVWLLYVAAIAYNIAASAAITSLYPAAKDWIVLPHGAVLIALFGIVAVVGAPVAEELLFRGWIYTSLRRTIGVPAGLIVSSALFALAHWEATHLYALVVFPLGLVLGYVRQRTGSTLASMTFHALYNGFAVALLAVGV